MNVPLPPAPPPPPPSPLLPILTNNIYPVSCEILPDYDQAIRHIEGAVTAEMERLGVGCPHDEGTLVIYTPILKPILQNGPLCGLVALVEAMQLVVGGGGVGVPNDDVGTLLNEAIRMDITKSGEMFSAFDMQRLVKTYFNCESQVVDTTELGPMSSWRYLVSKLMQGNVALIPYDADYNHMPSLRKGHAAHWAVIHGITTSVPIRDLILNDSNDEGDDKRIRVMDPGKDGNILSKFAKAIENNSTTSMESSLVIAHHGKSLRVAVWKYCDLLNSNQNLKEISPKITSYPENYILRDIKANLCSKLVILEKPDL